MPGTPWRITHTGCSHTHTHSHTYLGMGLKICNSKTIPRSATTLYRAATRHRFTGERVRKIFHKYVTPTFQDSKQFLSLSLLSSFLSHLLPVRLGRDFPRSSCYIDPKTDSSYHHYRSHFLSLIPCVFPPAFVVIWLGCRWFY